MQLIEVMTQMYRLAGGLQAAGRGISGSQQDEGLHALNSLLDGLKIQRLFFYQILRTVMQASLGVPEYSVGSAVDGAVWVIERPEKILRAGYLIPGRPTETEIPMQVLMDYTEYQLIVNKGVQSSLSWVLYYRASLPTGTARLWPVPNRDFPVAIYTPDYIDEFDDVTQDIIVPKGYREFLEYAGAVALHDRNPKWIMLPGVDERAKEYKARVAAAQFTPAYIQSDPAAREIPTTRGNWWGAREYPGGY